MSNDEHQSSTLRFIERERSVDEPLILCMVGLPARGKTFIAHKLERYLRWIGFKTQTFNIGFYRRARVGAQKDSDFFNPSNADGVAQRTQCAVEALEHLLDWLRDEGQIAIYDGTNSTVSRRDMVKKIVSKRMTCDNLPYRIVWIESICEDESILEANIRETKLSSPDYVGFNADDAIKDFRARIANYEKGYETVSNSSDTFIKLIDAGNQLVVNRVDGYLLGRIVFFLMNVRINTSPIFLTRHGGSPYGGDMALSSRGRFYANNLSRFMDGHMKSSRELVVFCSTFKRATETASHIACRSTYCWHALTEIEVGAGLPIGESDDDENDTLGEQYFATTVALHRRYPSGESLDVIQRLEPIIFELEKATVPVLVLADRAALRSIYAYFVDLPSERAPSLDCFVDSVFKLTSKAYGCDVESFELDTHNNQVSLSSGAVTELSAQVSH